MKSLLTALLLTLTINSYAEVTFKQLSSIGMIKTSVGPIKSTKNSNIKVAWVKIEWSSNTQEIDKIEFNCEAETMKTLGGNFTSYGKGNLDSYRVLESNWDLVVPGHVDRAIFDYVCAV